MKCISKVLKIGGNILFWVVIVLLVVVTVLTLYARVGGNGQQLIGGIGFGRVVTGSMEPEIPVGSFILIKQTDPLTLQVGDTITFHSDDPSVPQGAPVSHEIIRLETDDRGVPVFVTKGIANDTEDIYPVYHEDVIGKVIWSSLAIGKIIGLTQSAYVYPVLIILLGVSMIQSAVDVIKQLITYNKQESE